MERFKKKAYAIISEFEHSIIGILTKLNLEDAFDCAKIKGGLEQNSIGFNHYENVIKLELCEDVAFKKYCINRGDLIST